MERLFEALGWTAPGWLGEARDLWCGDPPAVSRTVAVPIWRDPWMVVGARTFTTDLLRRLGWANVYAEHEDRYPKVELADLDAAGADVVLLPDEPYVFTADDGPEAFTRTPTELVSGRLITWWPVIGGGRRARLTRTLPQRQRVPTVPSWGRTTSSHRAYGPRAAAARVPAPPPYQPPSPTMTAPALREPAAPAGRAGRRVHAGAPARQGAPGGAVGSARAHLVAAAGVIRRQPGHRAAARGVRRRDALAMGARLTRPGPRVTITRGILEVRTFDSHRVFDLTSPTTRLTLVGHPDAATWQVEIARRRLSGRT